MSYRERAIRTLAERRERFVTPSPPSPPSIYIQSTRIVTTARVRSRIMKKHDRINRVEPCATEKRNKFPFRELLYCIRQGGSARCSPIPTKTFGSPTTSNVGAGGGAPRSPLSTPLAIAIGWDAWLWRYACGCPTPGGWVAGCQFVELGTSQRGSFGIYLRWRCKRCKHCGSGLTMVTGLLPCSGVTPVRRLIEQLQDDAIDEKRYNKRHICWL